MKRLLLLLMVFVSSITYAVEDSKADWQQKITPEQDAIIKAHSMNLMQQSFAKYCATDTTANAYYQEGYAAFQANNPTFSHYLKKSKALIANKNNLAEDDKKFAETLLSFNTEFLKIDSMMTAELQKVPTIPYCHAVSEKMKQTQYSQITAEADKKYVEYTEKAKSRQTLEHQDTESK